MPADPNRARAVFLRLAEQPAGQRSTALDVECGGDTELNQRVAALLAAHDAADNLLDRPPAALAAGRCSGADFSEPVAGQMIGAYTLLRKVAEGGMGEVWEAEQHAPVRRAVALKLIKAGMDSEQVLHRFDAERQALGLMDHPNIAKVFDAGATPSGRPYFVMELVRGAPLIAYCDERRVDLAARLRMFVSVCRAVQHAHQKGVIHRDLKPSNVLVAEYDGAAVPKVIDFGVAKAAGAPLTERTTFTQYGQLVGTLEYMSPEQASFNPLDVDTRSDVYSLGVLLYELLTGSTPFPRERLSAAALDESLRILREEDPPRPSVRLSATGRSSEIAAIRDSDAKTLASVLRGELDWIVLKCLEKDRNRRYETPAALAADVDRFLHGESVQACPPSAVYRFGKLARRHKAALISVSALAVSVLVALAALATSTLLVWRANDGLTHSLSRERQEANFHRITLIHRELAVDNLARALRLLEACPPDLRAWEWHYLMRLCRVEPVVLRDTGEIHGVTFSPDGDRIASAGSNGAVKVWDSRTGRVLQILNAHSDSVVCVAFHPGGKNLATVGADRKVKVWDLAAGREVFSGPCDAVRKFGTAYTVAFRPPDGRQLAAVSNGVVTVWDWEAGKSLRRLPGHTHHSIPVAFSRDGSRLASGGWREGVKLWDAERGDVPLHTLPPHPHPVSALAFSADGERLATASFDRTLKVWAADSAVLLHELPHAGNVDCVAYSPDGRRLASAGEDKAVRIWDSVSGREVLNLRGHTGRCGCVAFSLDGLRLASASADGTIRIWDASPLRGDEGQEALTYLAHRDEIRSVAFSPDGRQIASGGFDRRVTVWDALTGAVRLDISSHGQVVFDLAWHPDGSRIASAGSDGPSHSIRVWDKRDGTKILELPAERGSFMAPYSAVAFSPDGSRIVTATVSGTLQVWAAESGREIGTLGTHSRDVRSVVFSRGGVHLASASADGVVKLWDAKRLDVAQQPRVAVQARVPGPSVNVSFSPDGLLLATGGEENTVRIWDVRTGEHLRSLRGHNGEVYTLAFSPEESGGYIASGGEDSAVKVWDSRTGMLLRNLRGHTGLVSSVAFSPDGRWLASGSRDETVKVWDVSTLSSSRGGP